VSITTPFAAVPLFGANRVPKLARSSGNAIGEFRQGREQVEQELEEMTGGGLTGEDDEGSFGTSDDDVFGSSGDSDTSSKRT
jgi:sec-independent protein translocase protein TatA